jgi:hypothetical protein
MSCPHSNLIVTLGTAAQRPWTCRDCGETVNGVGWGNAVVTATSLGETTWWVAPQPSVGVVTRGRHGRHHHLRRVK